MVRKTRSAILWQSIVGVALWLGSTPAVDAELVAHWKLDEGDGEQFEDSAGDNDGFLPPGDRRVGRWTSDPGQRRAVPGQ